VKSFCFAVNGYVSRNSLPAVVNIYTYTIVAFCRRLLVIFLRLHSRPILHNNTVGLHDDANLRHQRKCIV